MTPEQQANYDALIAVGFSEATARQIAMGSASTGGGQQFGPPNASGQVGGLAWPDIKTWQFGTSGVFSQNGIPFMVDAQGNLTPYQPKSSAEGYINLGNGRLFNTTTGQVTDAGASVDPSAGASAAASRANAITAANTSANQTAESARQFNEKFGYDKAVHNQQQTAAEAGLSGVFNGRPTLAAQQQQFNQFQTLANLASNPRNFMENFFQHRGFQPPAGSGQYGNMPQGGPSAGGYNLPSFISGGPSPVQGGPSPAPTASGGPPSGPPMLPGRTGMQKPQPRSLLQNNAANPGYESNLHGLAMQNPALMQLLNSAYPNTERLSGTGNPSSQQRVGLNLGPANPSGMPSFLNGTPAQNSFAQQNATNQEAAGGITPADPFASLRSGGVSAPALPSSAVVGQPSSFQTAAGPVQRDRAQAPGVLSLNGGQMESGVTYAAPMNLPPQTTQSPSKVTGFEKTRDGDIIEHGVQTVQRPDHLGGGTYQQNYANGGVVSEPMLGVGMNSNPEAFRALQSIPGHKYLMGEEGPEGVVPASYLPKFLQSRNGEVITGDKSNVDGTAYAQGGMLGMPNQQGTEVPMAMPNRQTQNAMRSPLSGSTITAFADGGIIGDDGSSDQNSYGTDPYTQTGGGQSPYGALSSAGSVPPFLQRAMGQQQGNQAYGTNTPQKAYLPPGLPLQSQLGYNQMSPSEQQAYQSYASSYGIDPNDLLAQIRQQTGAGRSRQNIAYLEQ